MRHSQVPAQTSCLPAWPWGWQRSGRGAQRTAWACRGACPAACRPPAPAPLLPCHPPEARVPGRKARAEREAHMSQQESLLGVYGCWTCAAGRDACMARHKQPAMQRPVPCKELATCKGLVRAFSPRRPAQCESLISLAQCESLLPLTIGAGTMPPMYMAGVAPGAPPAMPGAAIMPGGGIIMGPKPASSGWQRRQRVGMHVRTLRSTIGRPTASSTIHRQKPKGGPQKKTPSAAGHGQRQATFSKIQRTCHRHAKRRHAHWRHARRRRCHGFRTQLRCRFGALGSGGFHAAAAGQAARAAACRLEAALAAGASGACCPCRLLFLR